MLVLVCYDIANQDAGGRRRLRRIAKICEGQGARVQYSLFECRISPATWVAMRASLLDEADLDEDSLRFYFLDQPSDAKTEHHGRREPPDFEGPLIV